MFLFKIFSPPKEKTTKESTPMNIKKIKPGCYISIYSPVNQIIKTPIKDYLAGAYDANIAERFNTSNSLFKRRYFISDNKEEVIDNLSIINPRGKENAYVLSMRGSWEEIRQGIEDKKFHEHIIMAENFNDIMRNKRYNDHKKTLGDDLRLVNSLPKIRVYAHQGANFLITKNHVIMNYTENKKLSSIGASVK